MTPPFRWLLAWLLLGPGAAAQSFTLTAPDTRLAPLTTTLRAEGLAGLTVTWDLGDGTRAEGQTVQHTYYRPGNYTITARASRAGQAVWQAQGTVQVQSRGPEHAGMTLLIGRGQLTLSPLGSVIYGPQAPEFRVNGAAVPANAAFPLRAGPVLIESRYGESVQRASLTSRPLDANPDFETQVLALTNQARALGWDCQAGRGGGRPLPPLKWNGTLARAALAQSAGLALGGYFDHTSALDGSTPLRRVQAAGLSPQVVGENIAAGQKAPAEVVRAWLHSPGHCVNVMGNFTDLGVSYVRLEGRTYWTQVFGR